MGEILCRGKCNLNRERPITAFLDIFRLFLKTNAVQQTRTLHSFVVIVAVLRSSPFDKLLQKEHTALCPTNFLILPRNAENYTLKFSACFATIVSNGSKIG